VSGPRTLDRFRQDLTNSSASKGAIHPSVTFVVTLGSTSRSRSLRIGLNAARVSRLR
jgi:hypothetical protein